LLRPCRQRRCSRASEEPDELASLHAHSVKNGPSQLSCKIDIRKTLGAVS
jgi:hypothetical protein